MKRLIVVLAFLTASALGQEIHHAPTADQCKADVAVWRVETKDKIISLPVQTLLQRANYLSDCENVLFDPHDPTELWKTAFTMRHVYEQHALDRAMRFIDRNGLSHQFYEEDAKGAR